MNLFEWFTVLLSFLMWSKMEYKKNKKKFSLAFIAFKNEIALKTVSNKRLLESFTKKLHKMKGR